MKVFFTGDKELKNKFKKFKTQIFDELETVFEVACQKIKADAHNKVPVKTGKLKDSIKYRIERKGKTTIHAEVGPNADSPSGKIGYSTYIEYGTSTQRAQPYLRPAFESNKLNIIKNIGKIINKLR